MVACDAHKHQKQVRWMQHKTGGYTAETALSAGMPGAYDSAATT